MNMMINIQAQYVGLVISFLWSSLLPFSVKWTVTLFHENFLLWALLNGLKYVVHDYDIK